MPGIPLTDPPDDGPVAITITLNNRVLRSVFGSQKLQFPSGGPALCWGTGVPARVDVTDGDFYFRVDGAAGACVYQRRAGVWVATGA